MSDPTVALDPKVVAAEYLERLSWAKDLVTDMGNAAALCGLVEALRRGTTMSEDEARFFALEQVKSR